MPVWIDSRLADRAAWIILVIGFAMFFTSPSSTGGSDLSGAVWNAGHLFYYALLTFQVNSLWPLTGPRRAFLLSVFVLVAGGIIELCQSRIGRHASWEDVLNNLAGAWICLVWLQPVTGRIRIARIAVLVLALPVLSRILLEGAIQLRAAIRFPVLADFESPLELYEYDSEIERTPDYSSHGRHAVRLTLRTGGYTGITFRRSFADWSAYRDLKVDLYNPDAEPLQMVIRVNDRAHDENGWHYDDRFNHHFVLQPGWNHLSIPVAEIRDGPVGRRMDMSSISEIILYTSRLPAARTIYLDYLRLE